MRRAGISQSVNILVGIMILFAVMVLIVTLLTGSVEKSEEATDSAFEGYRTIAKETIESFKAGAPKDVVREDMVIENERRNGD